MRKALLLLPLLLTGCVNDSASYYIDGNDQTLTLRADQPRFWDKTLTLRLIAARLPDCQRQVALGQVPQEGLDVELFSNGDSVYTLRAGDQAWQVDMQQCEQLPTPQAAGGQPVGSFKFSDQKLVFVPAGTVAAAAGQ